VDFKYSVHFVSALSLQYKLNNKVIAINLSQ
jgi:hypothetical protein